MELVAQKTKKVSVFILYFEQMVESLGRKIATPQQKTLPLIFRKPFPLMMASSHMRCIHFPAGLERKPERERKELGGDLFTSSLSLSLFLPSAKPSGPRSVKVVVGVVVVWGTNLSKYSS